MNCKNITLLIVSGLVFGLCACSEEPTPKAWIPALEETSFTYFPDTVDKALKAVDGARAGVQDGHPANALASLAKARHALLKLRIYDIPMTEFRQLMFDADRLYYLGRKDEARHNVTKGKDVLLRMVDHLGTPAKESIDELVEQVEKLEIALDHSPESVGIILKNLGERVNLLLLKGDLVLAGATLKMDP